MRMKIISSILSVDKYYTRSVLFRKQRKSFCGAELILDESERGNRRSFGAQDSRPERGRDESRPHCLVHFCPGEAAFRSGEDRDPVFSPELRKDPAQIFPAPLPENYSPLRNPPRQCLAQGHRAEDFRNNPPTALPGSLFGDFFP